MQLRRLFYTHTHTSIGSVSLDYPNIICVLFWYIHSTNLFKSIIEFIVVLVPLFSGSMYSKKAVLFCEVSQILTLKRYSHIQNRHLWFELSHQDSITERENGQASALTPGKPGLTPNLWAEPHPAAHPWERCTHAHKPLPLLVCLLSCPFCCIRFLMFW